VFCDYGGIEMTELLDELRRKFNPSLSEADLANLQSDLAHQREMYSELFDHSVAKVVYDRVKAERDEWHKQAQIARDARDGQGYEARAERDALRAELATCQERMTNVRNYFSVSGDDIWEKIVTWHEGMGYVSPEILTLRTELEAANARADAAEVIVDRATPILWDYARNNPMFRFTDSEPMQDPYGVHALIVLLEAWRVARK
jgi:hypothetical protein